MTCLFYDGKEHQYLSSVKINRLLWRANAIVSDSWTTSRLAIKMKPKVKFQRRCHERGGSHEFMKNLTDLEDLSGLFSKNTNRHIVRPLRCLFKQAFQVFYKRRVVRVCFHRQ